VNQADGLLGHVGGLQGADEQLVVGLVDGVAALEGQHVHALRQLGAHLSGGGTLEDTGGEVQQLDLAACTARV